MPTLPTTPGRSREHHLGALQFQARAHNTETRGAAAAAAVPGAGHPAKHWGPAAAAPGAEAPAAAVAHRTARGGPRADGQHTQRRAAGGVDLGVPPAHAHCLEAVPGVAGRRAEAARQRKGVESQGKMISPGHGRASHAYLSAGHLSVDWQAGQPAGRQASHPVGFYTCLAY